MDSPARIDSTILAFSSAGNTGGLAMMIRLLGGQTRKKRALPGILTRDKIDLDRMMREFDGARILAPVWMLADRQGRGTVGLPSAHAIVAATLPG